MDDCCKSKEKVNNMKNKKDKNNFYSLLLLGVVLVLVVMSGVQAVQIDNIKQSIETYQPVQTQNEDVVVGNPPPSSTQPLPSMVGGC